MEDRQREREQQQHVAVPECLEARHVPKESVPAPKKTNVRNGWCEVHCRGF